MVRRQGMKKAVIVGLLAMAMLIGLSAAQDDNADDSGVVADTENPTFELCPDVAGPDLSSVQTFSLGGGEHSLCGKTIPKSPGSPLMLSGPSGKDLLYLWTLKDPNNVITTLGTAKDLQWVVPKDAKCLSRWVITLTVTAKDLASCQDKCAVTIQVECPCPEWNAKFCYAVCDGKPIDGDSRQLVTYKFDADPSCTVEWWLNGHLIKTGPSVTIDWRKPIYTPGKYYLAMIAKHDGCVCHICKGLIEIVNAPKASITEGGSS